MESWQIIIQNLLSLSESPRFPETKALRKSSALVAFQLLLCVVTSVLRPAIFSHFLSNLNTWTDESLHLRIPPEAVSFSCCDFFFFLPLLPWQTCMGKDVTLHVSASNPAMLLYQKFGFKTEEYILDFYDKYYPLDSKECKHAFFLRLRRWSIGGAVWGSAKSPICQAKHYRGFQRRTLAATWELERTDAFIRRTLNINSAMLCAEVQSKRTDSCPPRGQAWKCQLGLAETTGRLKFCMGSFPATVTLESLTDKHTPPPTTPKILVTSEGHGFQILKRIHKKARVFCFCFCLRNERLNLNHPQCFCDLIALLGTTSWIC